MFQTQVPRPKHETMKQTSKKPKNGFSSIQTTFLISLATFAIILASSYSIDAASVNALSKYKSPRDRGCYYMLQHFNNGDQIKTDEPCLNCTCENSMLMCYLRVCPYVKPVGDRCIIERVKGECCPKIICSDNQPNDGVQHEQELEPETTQQPAISSTSTTASNFEVALSNASEVASGEGGCMLNGIFYHEGAQMPSEPSKPCEVCYCIKNSSACVMQDCALDVTGCSPIYSPGGCCPTRYNCSAVAGLSTTRPKTPFKALDNSSSRRRFWEYFSGSPQTSSQFTTETPLVFSSTTKAAFISSAMNTTTSKPMAFPEFGRSSSSSSPSPSSPSSSSGIGCRVGGHSTRVFADGERVPSKNKCEHCYCMRNEIVCAVQECRPPCDGCTPIIDPQDEQCCPKRYECAAPTQRVSTDNVFEVTLPEESGVTSSSNLTATGSSIEQNNSQPEVTEPRDSTSANLPTSSQPTQTESTTASLILTELSSTPSTANELDLAKSQADLENTNQPEVSMMTTRQTKPPLRPISPKISNDEDSMNEMPLTATIQQVGQASTSPAVNSAVDGFNLNGEREQEAAGNKMLVPEGMPSPVNLAATNQETNGFISSLTSTVAPKIIDSQPETTSITIDDAGEPKSSAELPVSSVVSGSDKSRPAVVASSIPGEGSCRYNNKIYHNGQEVKSKDNCMEICMCINSVVYCDEVDCPSGPPNKDKCKQVQVEGECCPRYECQEDDQITTPMTPSESSTAAPEIPSSSTIPNEDQSSSKMDENNDKTNIIESSPMTTPTVLATTAKPIEVVEVTSSQSKQESQPDTSPVSIVPVEFSSSTQSPINEATQTEQPKLNNEDENIINTPEKPNQPVESAQPSQDMSSSSTPQAGNVASIESSSPSPQEPVVPSTTTPIELSSTPQPVPETTTSTPLEIVPSSANPESNESTRTEELPTTTTTSQPLPSSGAPNLSEMAAPVDTSSPAVDSNSPTTESPSVPKEATTDTLIEGRKDELTKSDNMGPKPTEPESLSTSTSTLPTHQINSETQPDQSGITSEIPTTTSQPALVEVNPFASTSAPSISLVESSTTPSTEASSSISSIPVEPTSSEIPPSLPESKESNIDIASQTTSEPQLSESSTNQPANSESPSPAVVTMTDVPNETTSTTVIPPSSTEAPVVSSSMPAVESVEVVTSNQPVVLLDAKKDEPSKVDTELDNTIPKSREENVGAGPEMSPEVSQPKTIGELPSVPENKENLSTSAPIETVTTPTELNSSSSTATSIDVALSKSEENEKTNIIDASPETTTTTTTAKPNDAMEETSKQPEVSQPEFPPASSQPVELENNSTITQTPTIQMTTLEPPKLNEQEVIKTDMEAPKQPVELAPSSQSMPPAGLPEQPEIVTSTDASSYPPIESTSSTTVAPLSVNTVEQTSTIQPLVEITSSPTVDTTLSNSGATMNESVVESSSKQQVADPPSTSAAPPVRSETLAPDTVTSAPSVETTQSTTESSTASSLVPDVNTMTETIMMEARKDEPTITNSENMTPSSPELTTPVITSTAAPQQETDQPQTSQPTPSTIMPTTFNSPVNAISTDGPISTVEPSTSDPLDSSPTTASVPLAPTSSNSPEAPEVDMLPKTSQPQDRLSSSTASNETLSSEAPEIVKSGPEGIPSSTEAPAVSLSSSMPSVESVEVVTSNQPVLAMDAKKDEPNKQDSELDNTVPKSPIETNQVGSSPQSNQPESKMAPTITDTSVSSESKENFSTSQPTEYGTMSTESIPMSSTESPTYDTSTKTPFISSSSEPSVEQTQTSSPSSVAPIVDESSTTQPISSNTESIQDNKSDKTNEMNNSSQIPTENRPVDSLAASEANKQPEEITSTASPMENSPSSPESIVTSTTEQSVSSSSPNVESVEVVTSANQPESMNSKKEENPSGVDGGMVSPTEAPPTLGMEINLKEPSESANSSQSEMASSTISTQESTQTDSPSNSQPLESSSSQTQDPANSTNTKLDSPSTPNPSVLISNSEQSSSTDTISIPEASSSANVEPTSSSTPIPELIEPSTPSAASISISEKSESEKPSTSSASPESMSNLPEIIMSSTTGLPLDSSSMASSGEPVETVTLGQPLLIDNRKDEPVGVELEQDTSPTKGPVEAPSTPAPSSISEIEISTSTMAPIVPPNMTASPADQFVASVASNSSSNFKPVDLTTVIPSIRGSSTPITIPWSDVTTAGSVLQDSSTTELSSTTTISPTTTSTIPISSSQNPIQDANMTNSTDSDYEEVTEDSGCEYEGKTYNSAQQIPRSHPCDFCFCFRGDIICLQQTCPPPVPKCFETTIEGFCCPRYECPVHTVRTSPNSTSLSLTPYDTHSKLQTNSSESSNSSESNSSNRGNNSSIKGCFVENKLYGVGQIIESASGPCLECKCTKSGMMKCNPKECTPEDPLLQQINREVLQSTLSRSHAR